MVPASVVMQSSTAGDMREEMMKMMKTLKILLWSVAMLAAVVTGAASCGRRQAAPLSDVERLALDGDTAAIRKMLERGKPGDGFAEALLLAERGDSAPDASYFEEMVDGFDDAGDTRRAVVALDHLGKTHYRHKQLKPATMALKEAQQRFPRESRFRSGMVCGEDALLHQRALPATRVSPTAMPAMPTTSGWRCATP